MATEQHVNGKFTFFIIIHVTSLPVHPVDTENPGTNENQGLFDCHEGQKECFRSFCSYLACFSEVLTLLNDIS